MILHLRWLQAASRLRASLAVVPAIPSRHGQTGWIRLSTVLLLIAVNFNQVIAQQKSVADVATPNAASLGEYGQVPVNFFNGLPSISVPLYQFRYKSISVPLSLDYHAGGNRTETVPGWVGLGWNLSAGGSVTRVVNGFQDEVATSELNIGNQVPYTDPAPGRGNTGYGNFDRPGLDRLDWTKSSLDNILTYYCGQIISQRGRMPEDDEADEFMFNAGDLSGSFFMIRKDDGSLEVKVKSKSGEPLKIEPKLSSGTVTLNVFKDVIGIGGTHITSFEMQTVSNRTFLGFDITRADGTKYTFGSNISADSELTGIDFNVIPKGNPFTLLATSWHLTRITSPDGYAVSLEYKKYGDVFLRRAEQYISLHYIDGRDPSGCLNCCYNCADPKEYIRYTLQHPSYLARIVAPDGTGVEFKSSVAQQLNYDHAATTDIDTQFGGPSNPRWNKGIALTSSKWLKLDSIRIKGVRKVVFNYNNDPTQRLRLLGLAVSTLTNATASNYTFTYNSISLPVYNSYQSDNWGYFNNRPYNSEITNNGFTGLYNYRTPDINAMKAEILEKIIYPTGGETSFFFEPHTYSKYISNTPSFGAVATTTNTVAGGLRIQRIESRVSSSDTKPQVWIYEYVNPDNTSSSGILSGIPTYQVQGKSHVDLKSNGSCGFFCGWNVGSTYDERYFIGSDNPQAPLSTTNGSHVTYSRVIERRPGNGYTVYTYTDAILFPDQEPVTAVYNTDSRMLNTPFTSRELERGLLLSTSVYDEGNRLLKSTINEYNSDASRYDKFVKMLRFGIVSGAPNNYLTQATAYKIYTFYPSLQRQTVTDWGNGSAGGVVTSKVYTYNGQNLVATETTQDSQGQDIVTTYRYPFDFPTTLTTGLSSTARAIAAMPGLHLLQYPIETVTTRGNAVVDATVQTYTFPGNSTTMVKPYQTFRLEALQPVTNYARANYTSTGSTADFVPDQNWMRPKQSVTAYDATGNPLSVTAADLLPTSYIWDYGKTLPVAMAQNAGINQVAYTGFEADVNGQFVNNGYTTLNPNNWDFDPRPGLLTHLQPTGGFTGRGCYRLDGGWGVGRGNLPEGDYEVSFWAKGGIANIYVFATQELSRYEGPANTNALDYRLVRVRVHVAAGSSINIDAYGREVDIDDVRLYPVGAQMTTYTHIPQVGVTSMSDANNQPTRYEYDGLQRLKAVRNPQGNIVKQLDYHYQQ